jgi:hypothetical protein
VQLSTYSLLEPPDNIILAGNYKRRNEITRVCKQYYEDGYKRGKGRGQRERNDIIMGEQRVRAIGSAIAVWKRVLKKSFCNLPPTLKTPCFLRGVGGDPY